ncbi:MAG: tRNA (adenosine(37)-N6)-dimethylallyltransferase MiaA [Desulfovibrio sp.]|jgi:tRNA dimethylallyltransferase|nr:tRNA (adenosine(37)-N6)-dimethylallyltransferase MiaA [Desulfovibrio sp.]
MVSESPVFLPCLLGPTGCGKSAAALTLARMLPLSLINADSRQVYRDFPIITAQPTAEEKDICPHLLYGFLPTEKKLGAGEYSRLARAAVAREEAGGRLPMAVGGTGLYFRSLIDGLAPIPEVPEEISRCLRERCRLEGSETFHARLAEIDPGYAAKIHPKDRQRVCRALEVFEATGRTFSWWHAKPRRPGPYRVLKIGFSLPLPELERRLALRIEEMLEKGALEEAEAALKRCPDPKAPGWSGIGCAEIFLFLRGGLSLAECRALWLKNSRAYAKRQITWFKADREIVFFRPEETDDIYEHILQSWNGGKAPEKKFPPA